MYALINNSNINYKHYKYRSKEYKYAAKVYINKGRVEPNTWVQVRQVKVQIIQRYTAQVF